MMIKSKYFFLPLKYLPLSFPLIIGCVYALCIVQPILQSRNHQAVLPKMKKQTTKVSFLQVCHYIRVNCWRVQWREGVISSTLPHLLPTLSRGCINRLTSRSSRIMASLCAVQSETDVMMSALPSSIWLPYLQSLRQTAVNHPTLGPVHSTLLPSFFSKFILAAQKL